MPLLCPKSRRLAKIPTFLYTSHILKPLLMSRICLLSGKRANTANSRSHSNIATKRRQNVNLQTVVINGQRIRLAARTIRTLKKMAGQVHGTVMTKSQKKAAKKAQLAA